MPGRRVLLRDSTLREGLDVAGLRLPLASRVELASRLRALGVRELELGAPKRLEDGLAALAAIRRRRLPPICSALVFAADAGGPSGQLAAEYDRAEVLMPAWGRGPASARAKAAELAAAIAAMRRRGKPVGAGLPHAFRAAPGVLSLLVKAARRAGADRVILYDTDGAADPRRLRALWPRLPRGGRVHVHFHNDLGLAVANTLEALRLGASGADVTLLGLGDRSGNCALEPLAALARRDGLDHGLRLERLGAVSDAAARLTGLRSPLHPVTGELAFVHAAPSHLARPGLFEALEPAAVGRRRRLAGPAFPSPGAWPVLSALRARRSIRRYEDRPVPDALVRLVAEAAACAPSSMDARPWRFRAVRDRVLLERLAEIKRRHSSPGKEAYPAGFLAGASAVLAICVERRLTHGRDLETASLAAGNALNAAAALGLGSCLLTAFRSDAPRLEREVSRCLRLPEGVAPRFLLPLGWPAETPRPAKKAARWLPAL